MGYSTGYFSEFGQFLKMAITQKFELRISSNFLHSIRASICIRKCNKNGGGDFGAIFQKIAWAIVQGIFRIGSFLKMVITRKIGVRISSNFLHSIRTSICIRKRNKNGGGG